MPNTIYGAIGIADVAADQVYLQTVGYGLVYDATTAWLETYNADLDAALAVFVERTEERHHLRYKLPATGRLQRRGGQARSGAAKAAGSWDVAFPIEDFGDVVAGDDIALAYMSAAEYQRHLDGVASRNTGTVRFELLKCLFNNTARPFQDETLNTPALTIQPLANGDAVQYPPVIGSEATAVRNRYIETGYAASAISDTNDPFALIADTLEPDFGFVQGGANIAAFCHTDQVKKARALADFEPIERLGVQYGDNVSHAIDLPVGLPGRIVGRMAASGVWIVEWRWIPTGWILGIHLDAPKPVIKRVDPAYTGLGQGLQLVAKTMDNPFESAFWRNRFGFGIGNRLNGVVIKLSNNGSYDIPTIYQ